MKILIKWTLNWINPDVNPKCSQAQGMIYFLAVRKRGMDDGSSFIFTVADSKPGAYGIAL